MFTVENRYFLLLPRYEKLAWHIPSRRVGEPVESLKDCSIKRGAGGRLPMENAGLSMPSKAAVNAVMCVISRVIRNLRVSLVPSSSVKLYNGCLMWWCMKLGIAIRSPR